MKIDNQSHRKDYKRTLYDKKLDNLEGMGKFLET